LLSTVLASSLAAFLVLTFLPEERLGTPFWWTVLSGVVVGITAPLGLMATLSLGVVLGALGALLGNSSAAGVVLAALSGLGGAWLTRYGLRDLKLHQIGRNTFETLGTRYLRALGFVFFGALVFFPFYWMVLASFKTNADLLAQPTFLGMRLEQWRFDGFLEVWTTYGFSRLMLNSALISVITVALTLVAAISGAYAVARLEFRGKDALAGSILIVYMFPAIVLAIPLYVIFAQLGLRDTHLGLLVVYLAQTVPVALYMLRSYFETLPRDLEEAGLVDGLNRLGVILRITLPLAMPALASVSLYTFMIAWNEFLFANLFLDNPELFTLSKGMVTLNDQETPRQYLMAGAVLVTMPVMFLFFAFERYLVGGLTAGGVKG
jgi:multiple sugar transport system permease protein